LLKSKKHYLAKETRFLRLADILCECDYLSRHYACTGCCDRNLIIAVHR